MDMSHVVYSDWNTGNLNNGHSHDKWQSCDKSEV